MQMLENLKSKWTQRYQRLSPDMQAMAVDGLAELMSFEGNPLVVWIIAYQTALDVWQL